MPSTVLCQQFSNMQNICLVTDLKSPTHPYSADDDFVSIHRINIAGGSVMVEKLKFTNEPKNSIR